ncbi:MAG: SDR family oxidoreductase [Pseudomonadota bacterium]
MSKTYAVTGVSSGIGASLAGLLKSQGHSVVGFDLVETTTNVDHFVPLDLNDEEAVLAAAARCPFGLDGLCNNAGLPPRIGLESAILQVNFLGTRAFTHAMLDRLNPGASIVNLASRAGHGWRDALEQVKRLGQLTRAEQVPGFVAREGIDATRCYNLSKEAIILWTASVTEDMIARGFRINSLSPGGVATGILEDFKRAFGEKMARNVERAGRVGSAEEIASVAAFVLSPQSHWLKGEDIALDGGMGAFNMTDALGLDAMTLTSVATPK